MVEEISISVPYANNGRVLRPLFGRLRPSSPGRIQGTEDHSVPERVPSGIQHANKKKGSQGIKNKNLPVIILSNYTLEECYRKANEDGRLDSLRARLLRVEVDSFIDFYHDRSDLV